MQTERIFRDIPNDTIVDIDQTFALGHMGWSDGVSWTDLLQSDRILIVAEAGAGKTYECRMQQARLWDAGESAFFLDLAVLGESDVNRMLSFEEIARFDAWLSSQTDTATFFLDSLDELKLTLRSFEQALKSLARAARGQFGRIRVVITTRPTSIDQELIRRILPSVDKVDEDVTGDKFAAIALGRKTNERKVAAPPVWRNVILLPLSNEQIKALALKSGVSDPDNLLNDITRRQALEFARRPQDLIQICTDWRDHNRIRTYNEQVEYDIKIKLRPREDRPERAQISEERALEGASRLALAALLTRKLTLRQGPDAVGCINSEAALDPAFILSDWPANERQTLLERGLFGFASYGRIRFHHRSVIEWLAASRLNTLMRHGMSSRALMRLLFADTAQRKKVVRPSLRPVAAWLSLRQNAVFEEVRNREPEILFNFGDAESLSPHQRSQALKGLVERYRLGGWRGMKVAWAQILRFASSELSTDVHRLWDTGIENPEVREILLKLIEAGGMVGCRDIAHRVANCMEASTTERVFAIDALVALSDDHLYKMARSIETNTSPWPDEVTRLAIMRLFPKYLKADQLCRVLARLPQVANSSGDLSWQLPQAIDNAGMSLNEQEALRSGLTSLIVKSSTWSEVAHQIRSGNSHLVPGLAKVCMLQTKGKSYDRDWANSVVISLRIKHRDYVEEQVCEDLRGKIDDFSSDVREILFWAEDRLVEMFRPATDSWQRYLNVSHDGVVKLNAATDEHWVRAALADAGKPQIVRSMMLEFAIQLWDRQSEWHDHLQELLPLVADAPDLSTNIQLRLQPRQPNLELQRLEEQAARRQQEALRHDAEAHESWVKFWREVLDSPDAVFNVGREGHTAWNLWRAMSQNGVESRSSGWNRNFIERCFGSGVADKLRLALCKAWRNDFLTLRSERPDDQKNTYLTKWMFGLAAITAEAEEKHWATKLTTDEASLAARYAPIQLNGYPTWLEDLAAVHPAAVESVLGKELTSELDEEIETERPSMTLQNIIYSPQAVRALFIPRLLAYLERLCNSYRENSKVSARCLSQILDLLLKHESAPIDEELKTLAVAELQFGLRPEIAQVWLGVLFQLDPSEGLDQLEKLLNESSSGEDVKLNVFASIFGERNVDSITGWASTKFTPTQLLRLLRLAYRHVHPSLDVPHEGAFTPNLRDNAEYGRSVILTTLLNARGHEGWLAKLEMAKDPLFAHFRDRAIAIAEERAAEEADGVARDEASVTSLDRCKESRPQHT